jgi:hypothetical protein
MNRENAMGFEAAAGFTGQHNRQVEGSTAASQKTEAGPDLNRMLTYEDLKANAIAVGPSSSPQNSE